MSSPPASASEPVELPLRQLLAGGASLPIFVESESMSPLLRTGDMLTLHAISVDDLRVGDIITLEQDEYLLTHRFYGVRDGLLQTRGDRNLAMDGLQPPSRLLGKIVARERNGRLLPLDHGWRGRHAAWLARAEWRLLAGRHDHIPPTLPARITHRLVYLWGVVIGN